MQRLIFLSLLTGLTCTLACTKSKDRKFMQPYSLIEGTNYHTPSIGQSLLPIIQHELQHCTGGCEQLKNDLAACKKSERAFHGILPKSPASDATFTRNTSAASFPRGCPCVTEIIMQGDTISCIWSKSSLYQFINDNTTFAVDDFHLEDKDGKVFATVRKEIVSPSGRFSVYQMSGVDTFSRDLAIISMSVRGKSVKKLPVAITNSSPSP
jgi:hypothetical protein